VFLCDQYNSKVVLCDTDATQNTSFCHCECSLSVVSTLIVGLYVHSGQWCPYVGLHGATAHDFIVF
jgi:hypothetical protein